MTYKKKYQCSCGKRTNEGKIHQVFKCDECLEKEKPKKNKTIYDYFKKEAK